MRRLPPSLVLISSLLFCGAAPRAEQGLVVAMNAASGVSSLSREQVINIFLGRFRQLPDGTMARPIDQPSGDPAKADFYQRLVNKQLAEIRAYWARLVFSGKTSPPQQAKSADDVVQWLLDEPGAIGYLRSGQLRPELRAVFDLGQ